MVLKKIFWFVLICLLFSSGFFFENGEVFGQSTCTKSDYESERRVCGNVINIIPANGIFACQFRSTQGAPGYYWNQVDSCSGNFFCENGGCVESREKPCPSETRPAGRNIVTIPRANHLEKGCVGTGEWQYSWTCIDGEHVIVRGCDGDDEGNSPRPSDSPNPADNPNSVPPDDTTSGDENNNNNDNTSDSPGGGGSNASGVIGSLPGGSAPTVDGVFANMVYPAIKFFFGFISIVAAAMVVYGAYMWMASGGDPQKTKMAQGVLTWAVIGLIFFMILTFFMDFILGLFGIQLPTPSGFL